MKYHNISLALLVLFGCNSKQDQQNVYQIYPETDKVDSVDIYFGEEVTDPYQWLEIDNLKETERWINAQNEVTFNYLENIEFRDKIFNRLKELYDYERISAPFEEGDFQYYYKNEGLQDHSILFRRPLDKPDASEEIYLDPNTFSEDGTVALSEISFSKDGSLSAHQITEGGSDWRKLIVMNVHDKKVIEDTLTDVKFSNIAWKNNEGFFYSSYDKPKSGTQLSGKTQYHKLYYHKLGTSQDEDELVFGGEEQPRRYINGSVTEDQQMLVITAAVSTSGNELYIKDLTNKNSDIIPLINNFDHEHHVILKEGPVLYIHSSLEAPNNRIVKANVNNPGYQNWEELIPESTVPMVAGSAGRKLFLQYLEDAKSLVKQFNLDGEFEREIDLPNIGTASGFDGKKDDTKLYYNFTSFTIPETIYMLDIISGQSSLYYKPKTPFDPEQFETRQVFYESMDGTRIPMFIVSGKKIENNGKIPTWLYGYGGFDISLTPTFKPEIISWLENGGIYVQPSLRGGGEYGEDWHIAGTKMNKQNVFDDFISAVEYLIKENYTSSEYLAIAGRSNGGLLVGATMTQRPELMKVALPAVGVLDMLRYNKFTAGAGWASDYGAAEESEEMFEYLLGYSPYHNIEEGTTYPATLITTADHDDRVVPAHSFKFAARLQEAQSGPDPVLIRIETRSGHGSVSLSKRLEVIADKYSFTFYNMGIIPPKIKDDL